MCCISVVHIVHSRAVQPRQVKPVNLQSPLEAQSLYPVNAYNQHSFDPLRGSGLRSGHRMYRKVHMLPESCSFLVPAWQSKTGPLAQRLGLHQKHAARIMWFDKHSSNPEPGPGKGQSIAVWCAVTRVSIAKDTGLQSGSAMCCISVVHIVHSRAVQPRQVK